MKASEEFEFSPEARECVRKGKKACLIFLIFVNCFALAILVAGKWIGEFFSYRAGMAWVPWVSSTLDLLLLATAIFIFDLVAALLLLVWSFFTRRAGVLLLTGALAGAIFYKIFWAPTLRGSVPSQLNGMAERLRSEPGFIESIMQFAQEHAGHTNEIDVDQATASILYRLNGSPPNWVRGDGSRIRIAWGRHRSTGAVGMIVGPEPGGREEYLQVRSNLHVYIIPPF